MLTKIDDIYVTSGVKSKSCISLFHMIPVELETILLPKLKKEQATPH